MLEKLKIAQSPDFETYLNQYNVICFDMNAFYSNSNGDEDIVPLFTSEIREELQEEFPDCGIKDTDSLDKCITRIYPRTGEQFILIIDEYDVLVREQVKATIFNPYLRFLNGMFKNLSRSPAFALVYITGILPVVRDYAKASTIVKRSEDLLELTMNGDEASVAQALNDSHEELCANLQYNNEGSFQSVIRLAYFYANTRYTVVSGMPGGKGFADIAFIPNTRVIYYSSLLITMKRRKNIHVAFASLSYKVLSGFTVNY